MKSHFQTLVQELKRCPDRDTFIRPQLFHETWADFRRIDPQRGDKVTAAMVAALVLHDEELFGELLTRDELAQLLALSRTAWERYQAKANPLNPVGKPLADALKEQLRCDH